MDNTAQGFHFIVRYRKGQCNVVPDALSTRGQYHTEPSFLFLNTAPEKFSSDYTLPVDLEQISKAQNDDKEIQDLISKKPAEKK